MIELISWDAKHSNSKEKDKEVIIWGAKSSNHIDKDRKSHPCKALKPHRQRQRSHLLRRQPLKPWISRSDCEELGQERVDCYRWNKTFCADLKDEHNDKKDR